MSTFEIKVNGAGRGTVLKDGVDISDDVRAVRFEVHAGELTVVSVDFGASSVEISADGLKDVTSLEDGWRRYEAAQ